MTDHTGTIYTKNKTKLSWSIGSSAACDKNQTGQQRDQSYRSGLLQNQN